MGNSPLLQLIQVLPEVPSKLAYSIQADTRSSGSLRTRVGINQLEQAVSPKVQLWAPRAAALVMGLFLNSNYIKIEKGHERK